MSEMAKISKDASYTWSIRQYVSKGRSGVTAMEYGRVWYVISRYLLSIELAW
jgi:hypothetical protein